jgi:hypothetical protein
MPRRYPPVPLSRCRRRGKLRRKARSFPSHRSLTSSTALGGRGLLTQSMADISQPACAITVSRTRGSGIGLRSGALQSAIGHVDPCRPSRGAQSPCRHSTSRAVRGSIPYRQSVIAWLSAGAKAARWLCSNPSVRHQWSCARFARKPDPTSTSSIVVSGGLGAETRVSKKVFGGLSARAGVASI